MGNASIKLQIDLGQQTIDWNWAGDELEWQAALSAFAGSPSNQTTSQSIIKTPNENVAKAGKLGKGLLGAIYHTVDRVTKPSDDYVKRKNEQRFGKKN